MEWFLENPAGMLAVQGFMQQFEKEFEYEMKKYKIDYCAWGHYYQKPTHVWTSMVFWVPKGTQPGGIGRCRQACPHGEIGEKGHWVHNWSIGQESSRVFGGEGRQTSKGAVPVDLHRELVKVRRDHYRKLRA